MGTLLPLTTLSNWRNNMGYELTKDITVEEISTSGFEGPDACPEESILTYGLVWKPTGEEDEYVFYRPCEGRTQLHWTTRC